MTILVEEKSGKCFPNKNEAMDFIQRSMPMFCAVLTAAASAQVDLVQIITEHVKLLTKDITDAN